MPFFDTYDRFYTTSETSPFPDRLNGRYEAIIARNQEQLAGKNILDIASHDGRWSFAALSAGAAHVTGIEARADLIDNARQTFAHYSIDPCRYTFLCGDIFELLQNQCFDVVLCLGFYYHTLRHAELLDRIERTGAQFVVIDTEITPGGPMPPADTSHPRLVHDNPYQIQILKDEVSDQQMAISDSLTRNGHTLVGRPSREAICFLAEHFGYTCTEYDWQSTFAEKLRRADSMVDYTQNWRSTFFLCKP